MFVISSYLKGLTLCALKSNPVNSAGIKAKGTDITLIRLGISVEKEYIPGSSK